MDSENDISKVSEWCEKLMSNAVKVVSWIEEAKEETTPDTYSSIRDIIEILLSVLPDDRETVNFLLKQ